MMINHDKQCDFSKILGSLFSDNPGNHLIMVVNHWNGQVFIYTDESLVFSNMGNAMGVCD